MANIEDTIRALLAKARGTDNSHEAQAFYMKASELMLKYNIEEDKLGTRSDLVRGNDRYDSSDKWLWLLGASAAKLFHVNVLVSENGLSYFAGRPHNVAMAEEMLVQLTDQVNKYYRMALPKGLTKSDRSTFRRNFKEGASSVIWHRVCQIAAHNCRALAISPQQLEDECRELTGKKSPEAKAVVIRHNSVGTFAGKMAGRIVELGKEVK